MANRIGVIEKGRLIQVGTPRADLHRPAQHLCRDPARPAGDQPDPGRARPERHAAGRRQDRRRADRAFPHRQGGQRRGDRQGRLDRASRRPEPSPCQRRRPQDRHAWSTRSAGLDRGDGVSLALVDPLYFDAAGNRIRGADRGMRRDRRCRRDADRDGQGPDARADRDGGATHHRPCRRADARSTRRSATATTAST